MSKWTEKYEALSASDRKIVDEFVEAVVDTVASEAGAVVMIKDTTGDGRADFYYGGNALLVEPLLNAGTQISRKFFEAGHGRMQ